MIKKANQELMECKQLNESMESTNSLIKELIAKDSAATTDEASDEIAATLSDNYQDVKFLEKSRQEIAKLKSGSIALIGQITTIDKSRIYTPRKSTDVLFGIQFSDEKMNTINEAIKAKLIF